MNTIERLAKIKAEQERVNKEMENLESATSPVEQVEMFANEMLTLLRDIAPAIIDGDSGDLEWLADDIINKGSDLAGSVRRLSELKK